MALNEVTEIERQIHWLRAQAAEFHKQALALESKLPYRPQRGATTTDISDTFAQARERATKRRK